MNAPPLQPRHTVLPDRERSRMVLMASDVGVRQPLLYGYPENLTAQPAKILNAPVPDGAFHPKSTALVLYVGVPGQVVVRGGRGLALGINRAFGRIRRGALPSHPDVVHEQESW